MISGKQFQNSYNNLYQVLRNYIWPLRIVESIAELEIAVYKVFPNIEDIQNAFNHLKFICLQHIDDEELSESFDDFAEILNKDEELYAKINTRTREDILDENF